ncbi:MAG: hemolysin family protein [Treponema sp.]|nr:hemolysin family protein [Treponema sp.]
MNFVIFNIIIPAVLIALLIIFSLFDYSLNACRKSRLEKEGGKQYKAVSKLLENPGNLLIACRFSGNILKALLVVFIISGLFIFGGAVYWQMHLAGLIALPAVVLGIIITLLGDILPKLLCRGKPEKTAAFLLPAVSILSSPTLLLILPVQKLSAFIKSFFHQDKNENSITEDELQDELRSVLLEGEKSGVVESKERTMVENVFYLGDRPVSAFMTHRSEIQWFDINAPYEEIKEKALEHRAQRCFPVVDGGPDKIAGAVYLEDIILDFNESEPKGLRAIMKKALFVPETISALKAFESFRHGEANFLFVMDEYGGLAGVISIRALVEEIVGELSAPAVNEDPPLLKQDDGSFLADGTLNIDDAAKALDLSNLGEGGEFHTLAGFILSLAGEIPHVGDSFEYQGYKFKVLDKDGNRIDKILITKIEK